MNTATIPSIDSAVEGSWAEGVIFLDRILVATDFSAHSTAGIEAALALAKLNPRSSITLLHVVEEVDAAFASVADLNFMPQDRYLLAQEALNKLADSYRAKHSAECRIVMGKPGRVICDLARNEHYDLIVMASHGRTGLDRVLLGSVAEQVLENAEVSLLVVKTPKGEAGQVVPERLSFGLRNLVVGYDHSKGAKRALNMARHLADECNGQITLVHAVEPRGLLGVPHLVVPSPTEEAALQQALEDLHHVRHLLGPDAEDWKIVAKPGYPWDVIPKYANETAGDLIVIGHHDQTRWGHSFAGSTAQRVVRLASRSVLAVKW